MSRYQAGYERLHWFFQHYRRTAYRLETRSSYGMGEDEGRDFKEFLDGGRPTAQWMQPWLDTIKDRLSAGASMQRVRLVDSPPSDFLRFEMYITPINLTAGEDIRYLERSKAADLALPNYDYWIFDDTTVVIMHFGPDDQLQGVTIDEEPSIVHRHRDWGVAALASTTRFSSTVGARPRRCSGVSCLVMVC
jgi:hypothetical protein